MNASPRFFLLRHGETEWSLSGRHTGSTDLALTARGEEEARELAPLLSAVSFTRVLASPRLRARQTAELAGLAAAEVEPDLAEWNYGDYEGLRSAEISAQRPGWNIFHDGCPGGESPVDVAARADRLIQRLRGFQGDVVGVSHGHFSRVLAMRWIGLPVAEGRHFAIRTASLGILGYESGRPDMPSIALWNETPAARGFGA